MKQDDKLVDTRGDLMRGAQVDALSRGFRVLEAFVDRSRPMNAAEVSRRTGLTRATVGRHIRSLVRLGYLADEQDGRLHLTPRIVALSHAYISATPLATAAQPVLDRLSAEIGASCNIAVMDRDHIIYLVRGAASQVLHPAFNTGRRLPGHFTAIGLVMMAHWPKNRLDSYLSTLRLPRYTSTTVTSVEELRGVLDRALVNGFAIADRQLHDGFSAVAVPIFNEAGEVVAGVNAIYPGGKVSLQQIIKRYVDPLRQVAEELRGQTPYPKVAQDT
jgi:IclR family pca regulon transcriptional regulator